MAASRCSRHVKWSLGVELSVRVAPFKSTHSFQDRHGLCSIFIRLLIYSGCQNGECSVTVPDGNTTWLDRLMWFDSTALRNILKKAEPCVGRFTVLILKEVANSQEDSAGGGRVKQTKQWRYSTLPTKAEKFKNFPNLLLIGGQWKSCAGISQQANIGLKKRPICFYYSVQTSFLFQ